MNKPASAPDAIPPRKPPEPGPGNEGEGTNEVRHQPDPKAEPLPTGEHKHVPHSPYTTGNS